LGAIVRINSLESSLGGLASQLMMLTSTLAPLVTERMDSREKQNEIGERWSLPKGEQN